MPSVETKILLMVMKILLLVTKTKSMVAKINYWEALTLLLAARTSSKVIATTLRVQ